MLLLLVLVAGARALLLLELNHLENAEKCISTISWRRLPTTYISTMCPEPGSFSTVEIEWTNVNGKKKRGESRTTARQNGEAKNERIGFLCDANGIIIHKSARPTLVLGAGVQWFRLYIAYYFCRQQKNTKWWPSILHERVTLCTRKCLAVCMAPVRWWIQKNIKLIEAWPTYIRKWLQQIATVFLGLWLWLDSNLCFMRFISMCVWVSAYLIFACDLHTVFRIRPQRQLNVRRLGQQIADEPATRYLINEWKWNGNDEFLVFFWQIRGFRAHNWANIITENWLDWILAYLPCDQAIGRRCWWLPCDIRGDQRTIAHHRCHIQRPSVQYRFIYTCWCGTLIPALQIDKGKRSG